MKTFDYLVMKDEIIKDKKEAYVKFKAFIYGCHFYNQLKIVAHNRRVKIVIVSCLFEDIGETVIIVEFRYLSGVKRNKFKNKRSKK